MQAIRVQKAKGKFGWHWLNDHDPGRTLCGKPRLGLGVVTEGPLEKLPALEACQNCLRNAEGWKKPEHTSSGGGFTLEPSLGTLRTTGPLSHGTGSRRSGRRLF